MARTLSATTVQALMADETEKIFILLVEIDHNDLAEPIRIAGDSEPVTHLSNTYVSFPFRIQLPNETEGEDPRMRVEIDNVDRSIIVALRTISSPPVFTVKVIRADAPDTIEVQHDLFELVEVSYSAFVISGALVLETFLFEPYPAFKMAPNEFPGLF